MNVLGFVEGRTSWGVLSHEVHTVEQAKFLDLTVDDVLLRELLGDFALEEATPLRSGFTVDSARDWISQLVNPLGGELPDGYAPLFVCQLCGDLACGFFSVRVDRDETEVRWSNFGWGDPADEGYELLDASPTFRFELAAYDAVLGEVLSRAESSVTEFRGLRRLWWRTPSQFLMRL